jgi:hypothetical protein
MRTTETGHKRQINKVINAKINKAKEINAPLLLLTPLVLRTIKQRYNLNKYDFSILVAVYTTQDTEQRTDTNRILSLLSYTHRQHVATSLRLLVTKRMILKIANKNANRKRGNIYTCTGEGVYLMREFSRLMDIERKKILQYKKPL